ncbi:MAG: histidine kinase [Mogibacterium sp.]|nr:histidine kinase [Mogibacterium sp.]
MGLFGSKKNTEVPQFIELEESAVLKRDYALSRNRLKPHFVNNVMTSIYYLCETDPAMAQRISMAFSAYMMNIIEQLETHGLAPFTRELDLVKAYIGLEELRLEDKLSADYDVYISEFEIPPMTLEPLVEIAVKHNIAGKDGGCKVTISTRRIADDGVQIKISDNGIGFDPKNPDISDYGQNDLDNIRSRLKSELGADLTVKSSPGGDTEFTIVIYPNAQD